MRVTYLGLTLALVGLVAVAASGGERRTETHAVRPKAKATTPVDAGVRDGARDFGLAARPVRVRLLDGATVVGTVHAEEAQALVIDCSLGLLSIPRARIGSIFYDQAAGLAHERAPVQVLDDADRPMTHRESAPKSENSAPKKDAEARPDE